MPSLHLEEPWNLSDLNLGSKIIITHNDSRMGAVSVTRRFRRPRRCMAACVHKVEALHSCARQSVFIIGKTFDPHTRLSAVFDGKEQSHEVFLQ